ncbi:RNA-binding protein RO60-like [Saccostrea echinata]|uniref:RNA-binding protein RO60-like n=1 Tax=Saccostrea echinata TaxID=191078 RepID=UPI002A83DC1C|nr:RNA-binding protein RO60-like [Saccostrea echinata]
MEQCSGIPLESDFRKLKQFLILGGPNSVYHPHSVSHSSTKIDLSFIHRLIAGGRGKDVVRVIKQYSLEGRAAKQNAILRALAVCSTSSDLVTKREANRIIPDVCRIFDHLIKFIKFSQEDAVGKKWGRARRKAISNLYNNYPGGPMKLAYHVTKYRKRGNMSHKDVIRLAHVKPFNQEVQYILGYIIRGLNGANLNIHHPSPELESVKNYIQGVEEARRCRTRGDEAHLIHLIETHQLCHEHVRKEFLNKPEIWHALLQHMPIHAVIRNLNSLASNEVFNLYDGDVNIVAQKLNDLGLLNEARVHPFEILTAYFQHKSGERTARGNVFTPSETILCALEEAFYKSLKPRTDIFEARSVRMAFGIDLTISPSDCVVSAKITSRQAVTGILLELIRYVNTYHVLPFGASDICSPLPISPDDRLQNVENSLFVGGVESSNLTKPIDFAIRNQLEVNVFVLFTSKTYTEQEHYQLKDAMDRYRSQPWAGREPRLVVVDVVGNQSPISSYEEDFLRIEGADSQVVNVIKQFAVGWD